MINRMVFRENRRLAGNARQRAQRRHAVVQRISGVGLVQVHRELVAEREQLRLVHAQPAETVAQRADCGRVRQLFQTQDVATFHMLLRGTYNNIVIDTSVTRHTRA